MWQELSQILKIHQQQYTQKSKPLESLHSRKKKIDYGNKLIEEIICYMVISQIWAIAKQGNLGGSWAWRRKGRKECYVLSVNSYEHLKDVKEQAIHYFREQESRKGEWMVPSPAMGWWLVCSRKSWKVNGKGWWKGRGVGDARKR